MMTDREGNTQTDDTSEESIAPERGPQIAIDRNTPQQCGRPGNG